MVRFVDNSNLTNTEKIFISSLKLLLKQNDILTVRQAFCDMLGPKPRGYAYKDWGDIKRHIKKFLLLQLKEELYFSKSDTVFECEFAASDLVEIDLPKNIQIIKEYAFNNCKDLKIVHVHSDALTVDVSSFWASKQCKVLVPKSCKLTVSYEPNELVSWDEFTRLSEPYIPYEVGCELERQINFI